MNKPKPKAKDNILSEEEIKKLKESCKTPEEHLILSGLLFSGMRVSEFLHLNKTWIEDKEGFISIPLEQKCNCASCKDKDGIWKAKTKSSSRLIPILPEVRGVWESYFKNYKSVIDLVPNRVYAWQILKNLGKKAKLKHAIFPHCLRASFATLLAVKGFSTQAIKDTLGWSSSATADIYIRLSGARLKKEFDEKW